jgi:hypothetical protein
MWTEFIWLRTGTVVNTVMNHLVPLGGELLVQLRDYQLHKESWTVEFKFFGASMYSYTAL